MALRAPAAPAPALSKRYRLHEAAERVAKGEEPDWSRLALELGYFDQAHFIKDFKSIIGKTPLEYAKHIGWGHSSVDSVVSLALDANVGKLVLFHHDPNHDDAMIDKIVEHARALVAKSGKPLEVEGAQEGTEILLEQKVAVA